MLGNEENTVMHAIEVSEEINLGPSGLFTPGRYLADDLYAAQVMGLTGGGQLRLFHEPSNDKPLDECDLNGKRLLIVRPGRFGDLVRLTPVLREIKTRWPTCTLCISSHALYRDVLLGLPYIDGFEPYPVPEERWNAYDVRKSLEVMAGFQEAERTIHISQLFAKRLGFSLTDLSCNYAVSDDEKAWVNEQFPKINGSKRVVVQVQSDSPVRDYPNDKMNAVVKKMLGRGWFVILVGRPGQINGKSIENLVNASTMGLSFRQSAAILLTADVFIGPDSAMTHIAGALKLPCVALYGSFRGSLRVAGDDNTFVLKGQEDLCPIAPCMYSASMGAFPFPMMGPCRASGKCNVLDSIEVDRIVSKAEQIALT